MKAFLFETGTRLEPFGDPVGETFLGGQPLARAMASALQDAGLELAPARSSDALAGAGGECLILPDTLVATRAALRDWLALTSQLRGPHRAALPAGPLTDFARPLQEVEQRGDQVLYDLYRVEAGQVPAGLAWPALKCWLAERAVPVPLNPAVSLEPIPQSRPGPPRTFLSLPRSTVLLADLRHWVHLLWINQLLPWIRLEEHWQDHPGFKRWLRSRGRNRYRRAMRRSVIGQKCDIHPTATVEGSILGDRVRLSAFAYLRDCIVGDDVEVGEHTHFSRCVIGEHCHTLNDSTFIGCTFYPESTLSNFLIRNSVLGRRTFLTSGVMFFDEAIEGPVSVRRQGEEVPTGRWMLGSCSGHGCVLGTRAMFLPGKTIPNEVTIVMRPEEGVYKLPGSVPAGQPYVYDQGTVQPLAKALPDWNPREIE